MNSPTLKTGVIPDLHGNDSWKKFVLENPDLDKYVFLGDYTDSFIFTNEQILNNLADVIAFKKKFADRVELLIGNHDISYIFDGKYRCSGFRPEALYELKILFNNHKEFFKVAYQHGNYLFTHAGVSNKWYNKHLSAMASFADEFLSNGCENNYTITDVLNAMYEKSFYLKCRIQEQQIKLMDGMVVYFGLIETKQKMIT